MEDQYNYDNLTPSWNYEEFAALTRINPERTAYARGYYYLDGDFYIEPWFYTQLTRIFERFPAQKDNIINVLLGFVKEAKYVLFTKDINNPVFHDERYRLIEINEIIIAAKITIDDISRGSDYGD